MTFSVVCGALGSIALGGCVGTADPGFGLSSCPDVDGPSLVFSAIAPEETTDLYGLNAAGDFVQLTKDGQSADPEFSSDGRTILFIHIDENTAFNDPNPVQELWTMDVVSGTTELVTRVPGPSSARWAPNGRDIAVTVRDDNGRGRLNVVVAGGEPRPVTLVPPLPEGYVVMFEAPSAWSPDGTRLAFQRITSSPSSGNVEASLILLDVATGAEETVPGQYAFVGDLSWSPDGESLLFSDRLPNPDPLLRTRAVLSLDLRTSKTTVLVAAGTDPSYVGDDGSLVAYSIERTESPDEALAEILVLDRVSGETHSLGTIPVDPNTRLSTPACVSVTGRG